MSDKYVAVDCGKAETKISVRVNADSTIRTTAFATRVIERSENGSGFDDLNDNMNGCFKVEYEGHHYAVGNAVSEEKGFTTTQNSKKDMIHKIATLTAISSVVNSGDNVRVAIGCPIKLYRSRKMREEYLNELLPHGRITIRIDGREKFFTITQAFVYPESVGAAIIYGDVFDERTVGIIDIGGLNINCCIYKDHRLLPETSFTEKLGRSILIERIRDAIEMAEEHEFQTYEIEQFVEQGYITHKDPEHEQRSKGFINDYMKEHIQEIIRSCIRHGWSLDYMNLVFIGGGSEMLKDHIHREYPNAFIPTDPQYINSKGFLIRMCKKLGVALKKQK